VELVEFYLLISLKSLMLYKKYVIQKLYRLEAYWGVDKSLARPTS